MLIVMTIFLILLAAGMPVAFAIGISGATFFLQHPELPFSMIAQLPVTQTQSVPLMAVPLFIFAGNLLNSTGITRRLIKLSTLLTGHMRGGLAQTSVVLSTLMGGVSGSSMAEAAMGARILGPDMIKEGYSKGYAGSVIGYTSLITATIPPGIGIIIYGTVGEVSIGNLFAAGLGVGLMMMVVYMVTVWVTSTLRKYKPATERRATFMEILRSLKETIWALIFPFILLLGLRIGIFTPSEVGAFACIYAIFVGTVIYRELTWKKLFDTIVTSAMDIGGIMFIIAMSGIFGYGIPFDNIPKLATGFIMGVTTNHYLVLLIIILFLLIVGCLMEGSVAILLLTPILLPMARAVGVDPVHFGLIMCTSITFGLLTPPVGINLYVVSGIMDIPLGHLLKESLPFMAATTAFIILLVFVPDAVLFFPRLFY